MILFFVFLSTSDPYKYSILRAMHSFQFIFYYQFNYHVIFFFISNFLCFIYALLIIATYFKTQTTRNFVKRAVTTIKNESTKQKKQLMYAPFQD